MPSISMSDHPPIWSCTVAKATAVDVDDYTEFESLAVKLTGRRFKASVAVCVYRPPGTALH